jgi:phosphatidate phosphatase APP1
VKGVEEVRVSLVEAFGRWPLRRRYAASLKRSPVVFPTSSQGVSVISDIDDTLIATHVRKKTKLLKTFLFRRFDQIKVFPGALRVLRLLLKSPGGRGGGALHYVTGSPASIADRLFRLFRFRSFPMGSMHMKRLRGPQSAGATKQLAYKLGHIRRIFKRYPTRRFVLIGDNGEKDPEVYRQARKEFPRQVAAILIHNVAGVSASTRYRGMVLFSSYADAEKELRRFRLLR